MHIPYSSKLSRSKTFVIFQILLSIKYFVNSKIFRDIFVKHATATRAKMSEVLSEVVTSFTREAMVRGYHIYNSIWEAYIGEELSCQREEDNAHDPYAVAVLKSATVVGHLPRKVSTLCSLFIRRGETIRCRITGRRRYSADLPQGGLEVPCRLRFEGSTKELDKLQRLLDSFCGKDAQLQDDIDTKDSSVEVSDQISSNVSTC